MVESVKNPRINKSKCAGQPKFRSSKPTVIPASLECTIVLCGPWLSGAWKKAPFQCLKGKRRKDQLFGLDVKEMDEVRVVMYFP